MSWRIALIDSCGHWPTALDAAAFISDGARVVRRAPAADPIGHGSRLARLLAESHATFDLLLGQVFSSAKPTSGAAVAAAIDWAVARDADLIHLSLGLGADRAVLGTAVANAVNRSCIVVASAPARGGVVYPASYPGVIRATGDARCAAGELSCLGPWFFGGCPSWEGGGQAAGGTGVGGIDGVGVGVGVGGASIGAAWVTRAILTKATSRAAVEVLAALAAAARYRGAEHRVPASAGVAWRGESPP